MKKNKLLAALLLCMTVTFPLKAYSYDKVFSGTYEKISLPSQDWSEGQIGAGKSAIVEAGTKFINNKANGILNNSGNLIVNENTLFENNTANGSGGAISTIAATDINNAKFINNSTSGDGGAVRINVKNNMSDNQVNISNSVFNGNKAIGYTDADSGAISIGNGIVNISSSQFINNEAMLGGAIYAYTGNKAGVQVTIDDCLFEGNKARAYGAVGNFASTKLLPTGGMTINNTIFRNNQATDANSDGGGAMFLGSESKTYIDNVVFENNTSAIAGGAIATRVAINDDATKNNNSNAVLQITNSTFKGNVAATNGGAIDNYFYNENNFIKNTTFDGNKAANGGAIYNHGELDRAGNIANLNIKDSTFINNEATTGRGGAIYTAADATIDNSTFIGNKATNGYGGAILVNTEISSTQINDSTVNITNSNFEQNHAAGFGGAVFLSRGTVNIKNSTFNNNTAGFGGAVATTTSPYAELIVDNSSFTDNSASAIGAMGLYTKGTIKNSIFANNSATDANNDGGGAMFLGSVSKAYIDNVVFENNTSASKGGAIATRTADLGDNSAAILQISNSTFKGNVAATNGGAIDNYFYNENNFIKNTIFDGNKAANGGAIYNHGELDRAGNKSELNVVNGSFVNNQATGNGGAIYNGAVANITGEFIGNSAAANGGAIYSETAMEIKDSSFLNNTASGKGGAIFANDDLKIAAVAKDVIFSGNTAASGSDIFMNKAGSTLTLNADEGKSIIVAGGIDGNENGYEIKINDNTISTFALRAARATSPTRGTVVINSPIQNATVNVTGGTLHLAQGSALTDTTVNMADGTTLNTVDNQINTFNSGVINLADNTNLIVDLDLGTGKADNYSNVVSSTANGIEVVAINPLGNNTTSNNVSVNILDAMGLDPNAGNVTISQVLQNQTQTVLTPIRYLQGSVSSNGLLTMAPTGNSYKDFNPAVMASSVAAQLGGYLTQLNSYDQASETWICTC